MRALSILAVSTLALALASGCKSKPKVGKGEAIEGHSFVIYSGAPKAPEAGPVWLPIFVDEDHSWIPEGPRIVGLARGGEGPAWTLPRGGASGAFEFDLVLDAHGERLLTARARPDGSTQLQVSSKRAGEPGASAAMVDWRVEAPSFNAELYDDPAVLLADDQLLYIAGGRVVVATASGSSATPAATRSERASTRARGTPLAVDHTRKFVAWPAQGLAQDRSDAPSGFANALWVATTGERSVVAMLAYEEDRMGVFTQAGWIDDDLIFVHVEGERTRLRKLPGDELNDASAVRVALELEGAIPAEDQLLVGDGDQLWFYVAGRGLWHIDEDGVREIPSFAKQHEVQGLQASGGRLLWAEQVDGALHLRADAALTSAPSKRAWPKLGAALWRP